MIKCFFVLNGKSMNFLNFFYKKVFYMTQRLENKRHFCNCYFKILISSVLFIT